MGLQNRLLVGVGFRSHASITSGGTLFGPSICGRSIVEVRFGIEFGYSLVGIGRMDTRFELRLGLLSIRVCSSLRCWRQIFGFSCSLGLGFGLDFRHSLGRSVPYSLARVISGLSILLTSMDLLRLEN